MTRPAPTPPPRAGRHHAGSRLLPQWAVRITRSLCAPSKLGRARACRTPANVTLVLRRAVLYGHPMLIPLDLWPWPVQAPADDDDRGQVADSDSSQERTHAGPVFGCVTWFWQSGASQVESMPASCRQRHRVSFLVAAFRSLKRHFRARATGDAVRVHTSGAP